MPAKRKKWKVTYSGSDAVDQFSSEKKTYEWLRSMANAYRADPTSMDPRVVVWVNEGDRREWHRYDEQNLSEWATTP